jgi:hypothetical protein
MPDDSGGGSQRRQRAILPGEVDPARSRFIDELLIKYRSDHEAQRPDGRALEKSGHEGIAKLVPGPKNQFRAIQLQLAERTMQSSYLQFLNLDEEPMYGVGSKPMINKDIACRCSTEHRRQASASFGAP